MYDRPLHIESVEIYIRHNYAGDSEMLLKVYEKLTMAKLKSSRLSYNSVGSIPSASMFNRTTKYEAEVNDSVVSFISSSLGYTESTYE
jgi:hypothetical protein